MRLEDVAKERWADDDRGWLNAGEEHVANAATEMLALLLEHQAGAERTAQSLAEWKGKRNALIARLRKKVESQ